MDPRYLGPEDEDEPEDMTETESDWEAEIDFMSLGDLIKLWRKNTLGVTLFSQGRTDYILSRLGEYIRERPEEYQRLSNEIGWGE